MRAYEEVGFCAVWASTVLYGEPSGSTLSTCDLQVSATVPLDDNSLSLVLEPWPPWPTPTYSGLNSLGTGPTAVRRFLPGSTLYFGTVRMR